MAVVDNFRGKAFSPIDAKDRVSVPADYRATILTRARRLVAEDGFDAMAADPDERRREGKVVVLRRDTQRGCLVGYDNAWSRELDAVICARHADKPAAEREQAIDEDRIAFADTEDKFWDVNGRIVIPARWRRKVGIEGWAVFLAASTTFEIWDPYAALKHYSHRENIVDFIAEELEARGLSA